MNTHTTKIAPHAALHVTLTAGAHTAHFYQPVEGGWRCQEDGPFRYDENGYKITFDSLDSAAAHMDSVAVIS